MMSFAIEAGDGLNEDDAAELNAILQQVTLYVRKGKSRVVRDCAAVSTLEHEGGWIHLP